MTVPGRLPRRLGTADAAVVGAGSMLGAGVFGALGPAAAEAAHLLLPALALAALVAALNALSTVQLAVAHPGSGGLYLSGRAELGPWWGFAAGWCFLTGKSASCAAMALVVASYTAPEGWRRPVAALCVVAVVLVDRAGATRTVQVVRVVLLLVLPALALVVVRGLSGPPAAPVDVQAPGPGGVLAAAGLLFFAFAGYARVATLAEEVRDPGRTLPRAVLGALAAVVVVYGLVALAALRALGPERLAAADAPLAEVAGPAAGPAVAVAATLAATGALLGLVTGLSRTALAMAREGDLPRPLAALRADAPQRASTALGAVVVLLVLAVDVTAALAASSCGVLLYYLVGHLAALRQRGAARQTPRGVQLVGAGLCVLLVTTLPVNGLLAALTVIGAGLLGRLLVQRARARRA